MRYKTYSVWDLPRKWSIPKKIDGATGATRKGPRKRCPAAERLSHLPCPLHQVRPSASAMALCTSPEHRFRPSASVKLKQAARSSLHALERRTWSRSPTCIGTSVALWRLAYWVGREALGLKRGGMQQCCCTRSANPGPHFSSPLQTVLADTAAAEIHTSGGVGNLPRDSAQVYTSRPADRSQVHTSGTLQTASRSTPVGRIHRHQVPIPHPCRVEQCLQPSMVINSDSNSDSYSDSDSDRDSEMRRPCTTRMAAPYTLRGM